MFLLLLPREIAKNAKGESATTPDVEQIRKQIAEAERIMAAIGGLKEKDKHQVSFEIVSHNGLISFYIVMNDAITNYMLQQIRSSYPDAELEEVEDYNIFTPTSKVVGTYLRQKRDGYFPIKTYRQFESDPFESLTNILSKIEKDESVAIQFLVRSAPSSWHQLSNKVLTKMRKGESILEGDKSGIAGLIAGELSTMVKDSIGKSGDTPISQDNKTARLTPREEEMAKMIEEKNSKAGLSVNIRILIAGNNETSMNIHLDNIVSSFNQYNIYEYGNEIARSSANPNKVVKGFIFRKFDKRRSMIFNTEELISLYHFPLPTTSTPNIHWLTSRKAPAPINLPEEGITLGLNEYRGETKVVRMGEEDRMRHMYIIGTTGVGKSNLMYHVALQDVRLGRGVGIVDPHGDFVEYILENMPEERYEDVIVFEPSNMDYPVALNMLEATTSHEKDFITQEMIQMFYKLVTDPAMLGPMFEHYMRNAMLLLMADSENPGTITEIPRIFTDEDYRKSLMPKLTDPVVRAFWEKEWAQTSGQSKSDMLGYLISKVGRFVENEMMRNIIGQPRSSINFKQVMREQKILLVNLSKGKIGDINSMLMGLVVVSKLQIAAFAQADIPSSERKDFYLFIDEFQNYTTDSISTILSEARKYRLSLTMAHQYLGQLVKKGDTSIKDAVLGNVGTMISFRIGVEDAPTIAQQMAPVFSEYDLVNMEKYTAAIKMLVHNTVQRAFSMRTYPPEKGNPDKAKLLRELSSSKFGRPRAVVEREILERSKLGATGMPPGGNDIEFGL